MTLVDIMQIQLAILQGYLMEMQEMQRENASKEDAMGLIKRIRRQRKVTSRLVKKTVGIAKMRDKPVINAN